MRLARLVLVRPSRALAPILAAAAVAVSALTFAVPAHAEDAAPVAHSMYDMALVDSAMPEGWKLVKDGGAADENAVKDAIAAIAKEKGLVSEKASKIHYVMRSATCPGGAKAVFALMDLDEKSDAFNAALKDAATAKGWAFREMAAPTRLLVVSAPEDVRAKAVEVQVAYATKQLTTRAKTAYESARDRQGAERADGFLKAALALDEKWAPAHYVAGWVAGARFAQSRASDTEILDEGIKQYQAALAKDATGTLTAEEKTKAQGELGGFLLQKGGPSVEARDLLKEAVAGGENVKRDERLAYRYNLACAHGRLKEIDEAIKNLTPVLEENAKIVVPGIQHWPNDPDFETLHSDPRWEELKKKFPPSGGAATDGN